MEINPQQEVDKIIKFIQSTFKQQGFQKGIIAVSGGLDSALSLILATKALGPENIYTLQLPYADQSVEDSDLIIQTTQIPQANRLIFNLKKPVDILAEELKRGQDKVRLGNTIARLRMIHLFDQAKKLKALVIGTENKSEQILGYYTRFGDSASDIEPISHLYKTQLYQLAEHLQIPENIIKKSPSAELWLNQTDEQELGFSYQKADPVLSLLIDKKLTQEKIINQGFDSGLVVKIIKRLKAVDFKSKVPYHI